MLWDDAPSADVGAYQETWADAKDILDTTKHLHNHSYRSNWSAPGPARGQGSGALVTTRRPIVARPFFSDDCDFDSELAHLWSTARVAGAWIETRFVDAGFGVLSFYGVSGANADNTKRLETERLLLALICHLGQYHRRPLFICADMNLIYEKSETMQALCASGWTDVAAGLGGTFKVDPASATINSKIDFVFANPAGRLLVSDVKLNWRPGYQHAAIDVYLHLEVNTGPVERLVVPRRMPPLPDLCAADNAKYEAWAHATWIDRFDAAHKHALGVGNAADAWQICEAFDSECLAMRLEVAGIADSRAAQGRGKTPKKIQSQPTVRCIQQPDSAWQRFVTWLTSLLDWWEDGVACCPSSGGDTLAFGSQPLPILPAAPFLMQIVMCRKGVTGGGHCVFALTTYKASDMQKRSRVRNKPRLDGLSRCITSLLLVVISKALL